MTGSSRRLAGRVAIVTGAGRGIGREIALAFAREGAELVLTARSRDQLDEVAAQTASLGASAHAVAGDISLEDHVGRLIQATLDRYGRVDVLVNNAGLAQAEAGHPVTNLLDVDPNVWDRVFAVNCRGPFLTMRAVIPHMLKQGGGSIINVTSRLARRPDTGSAPYGPTKAALEQLSMIVAAEFGERGIRVNLLHPGGPVDTTIFTDYFSPRDLSTMLPPAIMAPPAVWLASDEATEVQARVIDAREWGRTTGGR